jgi:hypothetical protein
MVELIFEHQTLEWELAQQRKRAAILRKAYDGLRKLKTDPAEVQWLYGRANQVDQDVVQLQRKLDDTLARLEIEAAAIRAGKKRPQ